MLRKILVLTVALMALFATAAQAHTASFQVSCGSADISWSNFASTGTGNGGLNSPTYSIVFTPAGSATPIPIVSSQVLPGFPGSAFTLPPVALRQIDGSVAFHTAVTTAQTRDRTSGSLSQTLTVTACPTLSTTATPSTAAVGQPVRDVAHLGGGIDPTGTITFRLFGPNDPACTGAPVQTVSTAVNGAGDYTSPPITPTATGTYLWRASYSGDGNNPNNIPLLAACGAPNETVVITPATPALSTTATPSSITVGQPIHDVAHLTGGFNPTGTITFNLYGPNDAACAATPIRTVTTPVNGDGDYLSPTVTPTGTGTYVWVATYSGDANNVSLITACADPSETVTVSPATPLLTTTATPATIAVGQPVADVAHLTGGNNPTGTITFNLYGPHDAACAGPPVQSVTAPVSGDGDYTSPTITPTTAGTYVWVATYSGDANNTRLSNGCAEASETVTVSPLTPALTTTATPSSIVIGQPIHDVAHLTGGSSPTGTITFKLYGPSDATCAGPPVQTVTAPVSGAGDYPSPSVTPTATGTYVWVARYNGDANNVALSTSCPDPSETVTVNQGTPALTTTATPSAIVVGQPVADVAHLSGGVSPTGTITFNLYGPSDTTCAGPPVGTVTKTVNGDGDYTSPTITPTTAGTFVWVATYSGDANNAKLSNGCAEASETVTVYPAPALTTTATPSTITVGQPVADVAHLSGGFNPTGTITFNLYGPSDTTCAGPPVGSVTKTVSGDGDYTSPTITPTGAGTYVWVATYSGDANNGKLSNGCAEASETVTVTPATPALTTTATPSTITIGQPVADVAHLSGGNNPTGTITFNLYGPNPNGCTGTPVGSVTKTVSGDGDYTSPTVTPTGTGTYVWVASYGGDVNNAPLSNGCAEASETVTVNPPPNSPSFTMRKLEADPSSPTFGAGPIDANVGDTIRYEIIVTNTGNEPLDLALVDTLCTGVSGPTGNVTGNTLAVGGSATWTCSHVVVAADFPTYVNVAQVTGTPPGGPQLPPQRSSVLANIARANVSPACVASPLKIKQTTTKSKQTINAIVTGGGLDKVVFYLDGRAVKTLTKPNLSGGRYQLSIKLSSTRYGTHAVTAKGTNTCGKVSSAGLAFSHKVPVKKIVPRFTG